MVVQARVSAFTNAFGAVLEEAAARGASDIHFEPLPGVLRIRIRVHGVLEVLREVRDTARAVRLMEVVKASCGFDVGKRGVPQDARFATDAPPLDYRAALVPLLEGESIVLRLLERERAFDLEAYPLRADAKTDLRRALRKRDGLIVVSGPTGSGKSTLLYNALGSLDRDRLKVATIEDPVEYRLEGVAQSPVDRARGASFAGLLRAFMRADPDVILVGEVRDEETAEAAMHAASTGHLVLTTVHANTAREVQDRLSGLGVDPELYRANLRFASAQRLVPRLCEGCRVDDPEGRAELEDLVGYDGRAYRSTGCELCAHTGVAGRALLFEWIDRQVGDTGAPKLVAKGGLQAEALQAVNEGVIDAVAARGF